MSDNQSGKRMRIRDIAEALGVSTATVSNVIHNKTSKISAATIERVQKALDEFGYTPNMAAISLAQKRFPVIGVVVGATHRYAKAMLTDPFISHMLDSISTELANCGYSLMLCRESDINNVPRNAHMWNWAGAIFMGFPRSSYEELISTMPVPYIVVDGGLRGNENYATSSLDNRAAGYEAGEYLVQKGHTRIGYISDLPSLTRSDQFGVPSMRYFGMVDAVTELCPDAPMPRAYSLPATYQERLVMYEQILQDARAGEITAVFSVADLFAVELLNYLNDADVKLPETLSVIGFDDIEPAVIVRPQLTTFRQNLMIRGASVAKLLLDIVEKKSEVKHIVDDVQMVCRDSVADIRER